STPSEPEAPADPGTPDIPASPEPDATAPTLALTSPARTSVLTSAATITLSGTATDNAAVTAVRWTTSMGGAGTATGLPFWKTGAIPLAKGANQIVIRAYDAAGNSAWRSISVTRR
ncbi:MAG TPA: Ig-like domain-containing protein, partial [Bryobacteraceae bacterium]|nr:Ig-like domain-containing protein [Bryobacteraceae bacterium]